MSPTSAVHNSVLAGILFLATVIVAGCFDGGDGGVVPGPTPNGPTALFVDVVNDRLFVSNAGNDSVSVYDNASLQNGSVTPDRMLMGSLTALSAPNGIYVDTTRNLLYVSNGTNQILVFNDASTITGDSAPARTINGLSNPGGLFVDIMADRLYVANTGANSVLVFDNASTASSASVPDRTLSGGLSSLNQPRDVFVDTGTDRLYITNAGDNSVLVFNNASMADDPDAPDRVVTLAASTSPWGIYVDDTPIVIGSTASLDGYVLSTSSAPSSATGSPATGDKESNASILGIGWRQVYSFDIAGIPTSTAVTLATLRLYQCDVVGTPYTFLGNVIVDHVNYGDIFDPFGSAYSGATVDSNIGTLSTTTGLGYRFLDVTTRVQNDLTASRLRSQFRLKFSLFDANSDFTDDFTQFTDAEDSLCAGARTNRPPQLAVIIGSSSQLYLSGNASGALLSYNDANTVSGSVIPNRIVAGGLTTLVAPRGIAVDMARNQIYVANTGNNSILVFNNARTVTGGTAPSRVITP